MRIAGWRIDGYGVLADHRVEDLPEGLTVVHGPNEAGKSTLLDFVRTTLFGFPRRRDDRREPLRGGRHGGALRLLDESGAGWLLERHADARLPALTRPGGEPGTEEDLRRLLGHADDGLFRSVFAFGLGELASLASLESAEVRDHVFSAGVLGAGRSATKAARALEQRRTELVRPRKEDARANALRNRLDDLDQRLRQAGREAAAYPALAAGCRQLDERLAHARAAGEQLRRRLGELDLLERCWPATRRLDEARAELDALAPTARSTALLAAAPEVERLAAERSGNEHDRRECGLLARQLAGIDAELAELERRLGGAAAPAGGGSAHPPAAPGSATWRPPEEAQLAEAEELAGRERALLALAEDRGEELGRADQAARRAGSELAAFGGGPVRSEDELRSQARALAELRRWAAERDRLEAARAEEEREERLARLAAARSGGPSRAGRYAALLVACATLLAVSAVLALRAQQALPGVLALAAGLALLALAAGLLLGGRKQAAGEEAAGRHARRPAGTTEAAARRPALPELARARDEVARLAGRAGVALPAHALDLDTAAAALAEEQERRRQLDALEGAQAAAQEAVATARSRAQEVTEQQAALARAVQLLARSCGLPVTAPPAQLPGLLAAARRAAELHEARRRVRAELERRGASLETFDAALERLARRLADLAVDAVQPGAAAGRDAEEPLAVLERLQHECAAAAAAEARRGALRQQMAAAEEDLAASLGSGPEAVRLRAACAEGAVLTWRAEQEQLRRELGEAEGQREALVAERADAQRRLSLLRSSDEIAELSLEREGVAAALASTLQEWAALGLARALLESTLARYEKERQPAVIRRAGSLLEEVTRGRYVQLVAREEGGAHELEAIAADGRRVDAGRLSRGTAEQLYLCLRLALAATFAEQAVALPLVLDDVLVNFDPARAEAVAGALAKTATEHQVLAFTCHPHVVELLRSAAPGARVVELARP